MIAKRMDYVQRENGYFLYNNKQIPAIHGGNGVGIVVVFEPSQLDRDFGTRYFYPKKAELYWFPRAPDLHRILTMMDESDKKTFDLIGKGWGGPRPYDELVSFM